MPPDVNELTDKQADLMAWVYEAGMGEKVTWSAKAYLGRSPTRSEAATLSSRLKSLVGHGLLSRTGRDIKLTSNGQMYLYAYVMKNRATWRMEKLSIRLEADRISEEFEILVGVQLTAFRHFGPGDEMTAIYDALGPLKEAVGKSWDNLLERLEELEGTKRADKV